MSQSLPRQTDRLDRMLSARDPALASLVGGAAAARTLFVNTHTHTYAPRWAIAGAGPGEILDTRGTNFRQVALASSADIPYPSGYASSWREQYSASAPRPTRGGCPVGRFAASSR
jgi:hypothetical protein